MDSAVVWGHAQQAAGVWTVLDFIQRARANLGWPAKKVVGQVNQPLYGQMYPI
jgi:hypothetical protein